MSKENNTVLRSLIELKQNDQPNALATFAFKNPELAANIAMLISADKPPVFDQRGNRKIQKPNTVDLSRISAEVAQSAENADSVRKLFPDLKTAADILVSSIRSPNDMYEGEINFELKDNLHSTPLAPKLLPVVRSYFKDIYSLRDKIDDIIRESLFGAGSYPVFVLPENSLSDVIRGDASYSKEAYQRAGGSLGSVGFLGKPDVGVGTRVSLATEGMFTSSLTPQAMQKHQSAWHVPDPNDSKHKIAFESLQFLDDPTVLMLPTAAALETQKKKRDIQQRLFRGSQTMNDKDLATVLYRNTTGRQADYIKVKTSNELRRYSVGRPLILDLPPESVIPITRKGTPKVPIGYIVLLDQDHMPISKDYDQNQLEAMKQSLMTAGQGMNSGYGDMSSYLIQRAASSLGTDCKEYTFKQLNDIATDLIEADFAARMRNGLYGTSEVTISDSKRIGEVMLYRALKNLKTQLLFVPEEMITYFNYQVNPNGTGRNLLEDGLVLLGLRAQLMFARTMGAVKNSMGRRKVRIDIDEDEPDAQGTFEQVKYEVLRATQIASSVASLNPVDIMNQIQAAGLEFEVNGGDGLPQTKIEYSEASSQYNRPDDDLSEDLTNMSIDLTGVPPEMIDEARRTEFATIAAKNHVLFSRKVLQMQQPFNRGLTHLAIAVLFADSPFVIELKKLIDENIKLVTSGPELHEDINQFKDDPQGLITFLCNEFISNLSVSLSSPEIKSIESLVEAVELKEREVDKALEYVFSSEAIDASLIGEEASNKLEGIKSSAKAAVMRKFMQENNMGAEVFDLVSVDSEGVLAWDLGKEINSHADSVARVILATSKKSSRRAAASDLEHQKLIDTPDAQESSPSSSSSDDSSDDESSDEDSSGGGGLGGLEDFDIPMS